MIWPPLSLMVKLPHIPSFPKRDMNNLKRAIIYYLSHNQNSKELFINKIKPTYAYFGYRGYSLTTKRLKPKDQKDQKDHNLPCFICSLYFGYARLKKRFHRRHLMSSVVQSQDLWIHQNIYVLIFWAKKQTSANHSRLYLLICPLFADKKGIK